MVSLYSLCSNLYLANDIMVPMPVLKEHIEYHGLCDCRLVSQVSMRNVLTMENRMAFWGFYSNDLKVRSCEILAQFHSFLILNS